MISVILGVFSRYLKSYRLSVLRLNQVIFTFVLIKFPPIYFLNRDGWALSLLLLGEWDADVLKLVLMSPFQ